MKTILKISILVVILAVAIFLEHNLVNLSKTANLSTGDKLEEVNQKIAVTLRIDFGKGNIKTFNDIELKEGKTVFALLKKVTGENNLELSFKEYPGSGVFIESIDGAANDAKNNKWWQFWVNGEYAKTGASDFQLKNGDFIEWKYIEGQF